MRSLRCDRDRARAEAVRAGGAALARRGRCREGGADHLRDPRGGRLPAGQAREYVGAARFESLDSAALVALCVRSPKAPYGQIYMLHVLLKTHLPSTITDAFVRLDLLFKLYKVAVSELTETQFWIGASEIARVRNIGFFGALDHALLVPFIVRLAAELAKCRIELSGSGSSTRSTPE